MRVFILSCLFFVCYKAFSQRISGKMLDSLELPVAYSPVALLIAKDSSIYKGAISDEEGNFSFENVQPGLYILKFSILSFAVKFFPVRLDSNTNAELGPIHLQYLKGVNLEEISVNTLKRRVEFKNGNITVNIANSALAAGNTAYDLLLKLPGVSVSDDVISIQGRQGVKVMINDRVLQVSSKQLVALLRSMSGTTIEKIEVLKNPPVRFDAAGTAGLINIKTKKTKITGLSGSATSSGSQGFYPRGESSFSLNYKTKKLMLFCDLSAEYGKYIFVKNFRRTLRFNSVTTELYEKQTDQQDEWAVQPGFGFDWQVHKKLLVGMKVNVGPGKDQNNIKGNTRVTDTVSIYNTIAYDNTMVNTWNYMNYNVNAEYAIDTTGTKLLFSADYSPNWDDYSWNFNHRFLMQDNEVAGPSIFRTFQREEVNVFSAKLHFEKKISETFHLEAGLKISDQELRENYLFENKDLLKDEYENDLNFSNHFLYSEKIQAGYVNFEKEIGDFSFSAGLRSENTSIQMKSPDRNFSASRKYFNLFPALSAEYSSNDKHDFQFSYNKRINRPDCYAFYPYKIVEDNLLVTALGNPALLPEYSNTFEFTHVYKRVFSNALAYSNIHNYLLNYTLQNDSTKEITGYIANLKNSQTIGYTTFCELKIRNWWVLNANATVSYLTYKGNVNGLDYQSGGISWNALLRNEFIAGKRSKIEVTAHYFGPQPSGVLLIKPKYMLSLAIKRKWFNDALDLVIGIDDMFYTYVDRLEANFQNQNWNVSNTYDTRRVRLSLSYNFGKLKSERREVNSNDEEKERLKH